ncbi:MAG: Ig-like domain-containing protein, partial [Acidimicrobiaceae bacterium]
VTGYDLVTAASTSLSGSLCSAGACGGASVPLSVDVTAPTVTTFSPADGATEVLNTSNLVMTTSEATTPYLSVTSRSCSGGTTATVVAQRNHDIAVGDLIYASQVGPSYDSGIGSNTYFRVTGVTGRNVSYAVSCTNESSTSTGGAIAPLRYASIAEDADSAKTISNIAISSNVATLTSIAHGFAVGDVVFVSGMSQKESNGAFVVTAADTNTFAINLTKATASSVANVADVANLGSSAAAAGATALRVIEAIPTLDSSRVAYSGAAPFTVTVNPTAILPGNTALHVRLESGAIRDGRSLIFAGLNNTTSWNFTTAAGSAIVADITSSTANGSYRSGGGTSPAIQVRFNQPVVVQGVPELLLNAGSGAVATYTSGSGTKTLTFTYVIGASDSTVTQSGQKLNVVRFNLPTGATMSGVTSSTPVPSSGSSGSLNANKTLKIDNTIPTPQNLMPFPNAVGVQATQALNLIFAENMTVVSGKKMFINSLSGGVYETITLGTDSNVEVTQFANNSGAMITVTRAGKASTVSLVTDPPTTYFVTYEAGAFADLAGNITPAFSSSTAWRFQASPDTVAPVFLPNQSDPTNNMTNFVLNRNIELAFSEAVSTVATKTIRLCTGDADCATPVETFTLPSASVTSASGGMRVVIDPEANLTASTTYFLLIDSGAFVDGAGNPTASAVTAGQFQFTASLPPIVSGGGSSGGGSSGGTTGGSLPGFNPPILALPNNGVIATCGPPPLPPCNVGPGINFGPGGLIQNPNALIGADMANLRPDNFVGFRPDDARLLGADALQNFQPSQFGALPPTAMAGFDRTQINNLNPAAMAGMNPAQLRALPPEAMQGFKPDQLAQLSPSAMTGFDPTRMAALPPLAMTAFKADQLAALPPAAMSGMKLDQFKVLPPTAISGMQEDQFAALPPQAMIGFKPAQFAALPPDAISGMQQNQFKVIPPNAMKVFTPIQMEAMPLGALAVISPSQFKALTADVIAAMSPEQRNALPKQALNPAANSAPTNIFNAAALAGALTGWNVDKVPATAFANFKPADAAKLSPQVFSSLNPAQFKAIPPTAFSGIKPSQAGALPPEVLSTLKPQQLALMPSSALVSLNSEQFGAVPPAAFTAMKPSQVGALPPETVATMSASQVSALPPTAFAGLKADQVAALPAEAIATLKPKQVAGFKPKAAAGFSVEKLAALTPAQEKALTPAFINALTAEQKAALNN